ncbi:hypothetical protein N9V96_03530 [Polaribacter sp.]|nr:hypothetical protein [Polaribacter sp.]
MNFISPLFFKHLLIVLFSLYTTISVCQDFTKNEIDSIQNIEIPKLLKKGKIQRVLKLNSVLIESAKKINYEKGEALAYIQKSNIFCINGKYIESINYLRLAEKTVEIEKYPLLKIKMFINYGRSYYGLQISEKAIRYLNDGILYFNKNDLSNKYISILYANKAFAFLNTSYKVDSTLHYLKKAIKIQETPLRYSFLANYFILHSRNIDSAKYYINKSKKLSKNFNTTKYYKCKILQVEGNFLKATGKYPEAILKYEESLTISSEMKKTQETLTSYKFLFESYNLINNNKRAYKYLLKYSTFNDSLNNHYKKNIDFLINNFLEEKEVKYTKNKKQLISYIYLAIVLSILSLSLIVLRFKKKRKQIIKEKEKIIEKKDSESNVLKQKINTAFEEVILLAKSNDPCFLVRFQEVYPNVCEKLLTINPKLVNTELILCAMIWLNFSSKDIATFTFVQPKTVQTKKYRLRKKLMIPKDINIYAWIKSL